MLIIRGGDRHLFLNTLLFVSNLNEQCWYALRMWHDLNQGILVSYMRPINPKRESFSNNISLFHNNLNQNS